MLWLAASTIHSAIALVAPMTVRGFTALSVETKTKRSVPAAAAVFAVTWVAIALFRSDSSGFASIKPTCL